MQIFIFYFYLFIWWDMQIELVKYEYKQNYPSISNRGVWSKIALTDFLFQVAMQHGYWDSF